MKEFPDRLNPENKGDFPLYRYNRNLAYMRKEIFELMLLGNENDYFDIDIFSRKYKVEKKDLDKMLNTIKEELVELGWNVKTSFGTTGLFIYSTDTPPPSCYDDEL
jgi:hypothetical protein